MVRKDHMFGFALCLMAAAQVVRAGDYVALLAYLPSNDPGWEKALQAFRHAIAARTGTSSPKVLSFAAPSRSCRPRVPAA